MRRWSRWLVPLVFAAWLTLVSGGFVAYAILEPTDSGFTRGSNRISAFLGWQFAALLVAGIGFACRPGGRDAGPVYWLARIPLWSSSAFFALLVIFLAGLFAYTWLVGA